MCPKALRLLIVVVSFLSTISCVFPGKVTPEARGKVLDATNKKPIAGATIRIQHHSQDAISESTSGLDGQFIVPPARGLIYPMGSLVIVAGRADIQAEGYKPVNVNSVRADSLTGYQYCDLGEIHLNRIGEQGVTPNP